MEIRVCDSCKEVVESIVSTKYEGGYAYTVYQCPKCGHKKILTKNHIHYGNDGK